MKTFKTEFHPTTQQEEYIRKACGIRRWTWNWAVATYFEEAKNDVFLTAWDLNKRLNNGLVKENGYEWLSDVNSMVRSGAINDFGVAIIAYAKAKKYSKLKSENNSIDKYKPHFKKKGKCTESFRIFKKGGSEFKVHSAHDFSMVTTRGHQRLHIHPLESVEFLKSADIKTCTISMQGGKFFMSLTYEKTNQRKQTCGTGKVGIDLGIKHAAVCFDGTSTKFIDTPPTLKAAEKKTERFNQRLAVTTKGSKRHSKALRALQRAYMHEANIKKDWREKLTTELIRSYGQINIDDFSFEGAKNLNVNRALYRVGCYLFKLRLEQKAEASGCTINYVPQFTPTTRTCSKCGEVQVVQISDRTYSCKHCGLVIDRDENAARNVYNYC